jgi:hypothetical protein
MAEIPLRLFWSVLLLSEVCAVVVGDNSDYEKTKAFEGINCKNGLIIPLWDAALHLPRVIPGIIYTSVLVYLLLGVAIFLNKMMLSLETTTSLMKRTTVSDPDSGQSQDIIVKIWNQGISNMIMILGSSSPLISLCIIGVSSTNFGSPELVPYTVMGSAMFTLFISVGIIVSAVPKDQVRRLDSVFALLYIVFWSVFLYPFAFITYGGPRVRDWEDNQAKHFGHFRPYILISELWIYSRSLAN